jgi:hypothetical protein
MGEVGKTYHVTLDIRSALKWPDRKLGKMLVRESDGVQLTADQAREHLIECLRQGFDSMPCCDNYDDKGRCQGHPTPRA